MYIGVAVNIYNISYIPLELVNELLIYLYQYNVEDSIQDTQDTDETNDNDKKDYQGNRQIDDQIDSQ